MFFEYRLLLFWICHNLGLIFYIELKHHHLLFLILKQKTILLSNNNLYVSYACNSTPCYGMVCMGDLSLEKKEYTTPLKPIHRVLGFLIVHLSSRHCSNMHYYPEFEFMKDHEGVFLDLQTFQWMFCVQVINCLCKEVFS